MAYTARTIVLLGMGLGCSSTGQSVGLPDASVSHSQDAHGQSSSGCGTLETCTRSSSYSCTGFACGGTTIYNTGKEISLTDRTCVGAGVSCHAITCTIAGESSGSFTCKGALVCQHDWGGGEAQCSAARGALDGGAIPDVGDESGTCPPLHPSSDGQFVVGWSIKGSCAPSACAVSGVATIYVTVTASSTGVVTNSIAMSCAGGDGSFEGTIGGPRSYDTIVSITAKDAQGRAVTTTQTVAVPAMGTGQMRFDFSEATFLVDPDERTADAALESADGAFSGARADSDAIDQGQ